MMSLGQRRSSVRTTAGTVPASETPTRLAIHHQNELMPRYMTKNPNPLPAGSFRLKLHEREVNLGKAAQEEEDDERYIVPVKADIMFQPEDDEIDDPEENWTKIGYIEGNIVLVALITNSGLSEEYQLICDSHSQGLANIMGAIFNEDGDHKNTDLDEFDQGDRMVIDEVYLEPRWRGYGIGLLAVRGLIDALPSFNMDLVILDPVPMTRANGQEGCYPAQSLDRTIVSLCRYWSLLGFQRASQKKDIHYMELWTGLRLPRAEEIVPHLF